MEKSTKETSRKIYAMKAAFSMLSGLALLYSFLLLIDKNPSEIVFTALIAAIGTIVSALNIADGIKGHEHRPGNTG